jgi:hypothetical protein
VFLDHNQPRDDRIRARFVLAEKYGFGECIMMVRPIGVLSSGHHLGKLLIGAASNLAFNQ